MNPAPSSMVRFRAGFSSVELLVTLVVLAVMVVLASVAYRAAVMRTRQTASAQTMKGIGLALANHVTDKGALPGPTNAGQSPYFAGNKLIGYLWPYLGYSKRPEKGALLPGFVPAHWMAWLEANNRPEKVQLYKVVCTFSDEGEKLILFGYWHTNPPHDVPMNWSALSARITLSRQVALQDVPSDEATGQNLVPQGLQDYTTFLYLDWHVEMKKNP